LVSSDANYSNKALADFFSGKDAKIDDPALMSKKNLVLKQNPLSLIN
jgi:hypothetical protein